MCVTNTLKLLLIKLLLTLKPMGKVPGIREAFLAPLITYSYMFGYVYESTNACNVLRYSSLSRDTAPRDSDSYQRRGSILGWTPLATLATI
jgi:hypothetical protein